MCLFGVWDEFKGNRPDIYMVLVEKIRAIQTAKDLVEEKERNTNKEIQRLNDNIVKLEKVDTVIFILYTSWIKFLL